MEINGIEIGSLESSVKPVYDYFKVDIGDEKIVEKIIDFINSLIETHNIEVIQPFVWNEPVLNIQSLKTTVYHGIKTFDLKYIKEKNSDNKFDIETLYSKWIKTFGNFILEVLTLTKEDDPTIQHWLNYEDFIEELKLTQVGNEILGKIYDLRGLDFFLIHYIGGETLAIEDNALFSNAKNIIKALKFLGRKEESILVEKEIYKREQGIKKIITQYNTPNFEDLNTMELMRVQAEKFWIDYFSDKIWQYLNQASRTELIDAFITEKFLENGILTNWSQVALSLCKVIERELSETFFLPWIKEIKKSTFNTPNNLSKTKEKKIKSRKYTFDTMKKCTIEPIHPPTLGQILFICKFWNDPVMDECTDLFINIRKQLKDIYKNYDDDVLSLVKMIEEKHIINNEQINIVEIRNASAHPGKEFEIEWENHIQWLKKSLGKPPKEIINLIVLILRPTQLYVKKHNKYEERNI